MSSRDLFTLVVGTLVSLFCLFIFVRMAPRAYKMTRARRRKEGYESVDVRIVGYRPDSEYDYCTVYVERTDGKAHNRTNGCFSQFEVSDEEELKRKIGTHLTMYAQPSVPEMLYSESALQEKNRELGEWCLSIFFSFAAMVGCVTCAWKVIMVLMKI